MLIRKMIVMAKSTKMSKLAFNFEDFIFKNIKLSEEEIGEIVGTQLDFANYEFIDYKTPPEEGFSFIEEVFIFSTKEKVENARLAEMHRLNALKIELTKTKHDILRAIDNAKTPEDLKVLFLSMITIY